MPELVSLPPDPILAWGLECIRALQSFQSPFLTGFFQSVTLLGTTELYIVVLCLLYWRGDRRLGARLLVLMFFSGWLNALLKEVIMLPRPFENMPELQLFPTSGFALPSGHAQSAVVVWGGLMLWSKRRSGLVGFCLILIALIGVSRVYLGVHYPTDILAGWLLGLVCLVVFHYSYGVLEPQLFALESNRRLRLAFSLPVILTLLHLTPRCVAHTACLLGVLVGLSLAADQLRSFGTGTRSQLALQVAAGALMAVCWYVVLHFSVVVANSKPLLAVSFVMLAAAWFFASHLLPSLLQRRSVALKEYG